MIKAERDALIRRLAAELLIAQKPRSFYALGLLDLRRFHSGGRYLLDTFEAFCTQASVPLPSPIPDGMTLKSGSAMPIILYSASLHPHRRNWTIAHEIGHLLLSHTAQSPAAEREADAFAAALLMPAAVVAAWEERKGEAMSAEEMTRAFAVSPLSAKRRRLDLCAYPCTAYSDAEKALAALLFSAEAKSRTV